MLGRINIHASWVKLWITLNKDKHVIYIHVSFITAICINNLQSQVHSNVHCKTPRHSGRNMHFNFKIILKNYVPQNFRVKKKEEEEEKKGV